MRAKFVKTLEELAKRDKNNELITGDLKFGAPKPSFWETALHQFTEAGIIEQNMTTLAVDTALTGKTVFTYRIGNLQTLRCLDQFRNDCAYNNANVKDISIGGGFICESLGMSYQSIEDIAFFKTLPDVVVMTPGVHVQAEECTKALEDKESDLYLVNTPYHLMLACNNCTPKDVLVCAGKFKYTDTIKRMIKRTFGGNFYETQNFYYYRNDIKKLPSFRKNINALIEEIKSYHFKDVYIYNDVDPITQRIVAKVNYFGKVILTEEGIGMYRDTQKRHKILFKAFGKVGFGRTYEEIDRIGESSFVKKIICSYPAKLSERQKMKEVQVLERMDFQKLANTLGVSQYSGRDWFIGQPLVEDGVMTKNEYSFILQKLIDHRKALNEHKIIVKPHPREEIDKYRALKIELLATSEIPVELLIDSKEKTSVFTLYSSAVLSLATTKNIKTYALYRMTTAKESLSNDISNLFQDKGVKIISSLEELEKGV